MSANHAAKLINWTVTICAAVLAVVSITTMLYTLDAVDARREAQVASCERGNNVRQTLNVIVAAHPELGLRRLPIIDCSLI